jgi:hypothetical protein
MTKRENQELLSTEEGQPIVVGDGVPHTIRRIVMPAIALAVGLLAGGVAHTFTEQGRLRPPVKPVASAVELKYAANTSALEGKTQLATDSATQVQPDGWCGTTGQTHVRCSWPGTCCIGVKGNICGGEGAGCFAGGAGSIVCAVGSVGCLNDVGAAYCCAEGNTCSQNVCLAGPGQCFPGESSVTVKDVGAVPLQNLRSGDEVLGKNGVYEPVLGFLHVTGAGQVSDFLVVKHSHGQLRVSPHHVIFVETGDKLAADVGAGDKVFVSDGSSAVLSEVLSVVRSSGRSGMFAPLTPSGTVVVDNVVASNYASYAHTWFPHNALHAVFFPVRAFHALGLASILQKDANTKEHLHPYASAIWQFVGPMATKVF